MNLCRMRIISGIVLAQFCLSSFGQEYEEQAAWLTYNNHQYFISPAGERVSYSTAWNACGKLEAELAPVLDRSTQDWLVSHLPQVPAFNCGTNSALYKFWIGLSIKEPECTNPQFCWFWQDGSRPTYLNWLDRRSETGYAEPEAHDDVTVMSGCNDYHWVGHAKSVAWRFRYICRKAVTDQTTEFGGASGDRGLLNDSNLLLILIAVSILALVLCLVVVFMCVLMCKKKWHRRFTTSRPATEWNYHSSPMESPKYEYVDELQNTSEVDSNMTAASSAVLLAGSKNPKKILMPVGGKKTKVGDYLYDEVQPSPEGKKPEFFADWEEGDMPYVSQFDQPVYKGGEIPIYGPEVVVEQAPRKYDNNMRLMSNSSEPSGVTGVVSLPTSPDYVSIGNEGGEAAGGSAAEPKKFDYVNMNYPAKSRSATNLARVHSNASAKQQLHKKNSYENTDLNSPAAPKLNIAELQDILKSKSVGNLPKIHERAELEKPGRVKEVKSQCTSPDYANIQAKNPFGDAKPKTDLQVKSHPNLNKAGGLRPVVMEKPKL